MKLIKQKAELLIQGSGLDGIYKQIEKCGRTCYRSEDKIAENSAKPFVDRMIASNHTAMLEHGTVYLYLEVNPENGLSSFDYPLAKFTAHYNWSDVVGNIAARYRSNPYSKVVKKTESSKTSKGLTRIVHKTYITTNYRVIIENNWNDDLQFLCVPTEFHEKRYTFRMTTSIGVTRELNRHKVNSIAEQSTRYCNYSKDKFGNEIAICIPSWLNLPEISVKYHDGVYVDTPGFSIVDFKNENSFLWAAAFAEEQYFELLEQGWQPQQAREILPLCTASEIVHTAFAFDWKHFFDLRLFGKTGKPHPNMLRLAELMKEEAEKIGIWEDIIMDHLK